MTTPDAGSTPETDPLTLAYQQAVRAPGSTLAAAVQRSESRLREAGWHGSYLSRPLFADRGQLTRFAADVRCMLELLVTLPDRLCNGDLDRYCALVGIPAANAALARRLGGGPPPLTGRADMYHDGTSFKLLEFGLASTVGGVDRAGEIPKALLSDQEFAAFADRHRLGFTDTGYELAQSLREAAAPVTGDRAPVVALVEGPGDLARYGTTWRPLQALLRRHGLECHIGELDQLRIRDGRLRLGTDPIDLVFRCFGTDQVIEAPNGLDLIEPVLRAHREGTAVIWIPMESELFASKAGMALLSDPRFEDAYSAREREAIARALPWTRSLTSPADLADSALLERCMDQRERLVVKPHSLFGGQGVVAGWETDEQRWRQVLHEGAETGCVIQERVRPRPEPVTDPVTGAEQDWHTAWGLFYTPRGHAGAYGRALPAGRSAVIGISAHPDTRTAGVLLGGAE